MWHTLRMAPRERSDSAFAATELLRSTSRSVILTAGGIYAAFVYATAIWPERLAMQVWPILPLIILTCVLALHLLSRHFLLAQMVLHVGLAASIALGTYISRQPEVVLFVALLPLMAVVAAGWPFGLVAECLVIALVWWLSLSPVMPPISIGVGLAAVLGGLCTGLLGWASTRTLLTTTQWSLHSYEQAWEKMEEAREHRLELRQVQEDLIKANQELARLSDRLKAMYQVAEEARRAKEEFVANVSHELRTPLNMIIGFSEAITESPHIYGNGLPPKLLADISTIRRNSQRLSKLVDDVLDLSQIEAGRMALSKERVSLQEVVDDAALAVGPLFESKGLYLEMDVSADLPPIFCDVTRVSQVVTNLLSNAGRFTEQGGVRLQARREGNEIVVSVNDTGPGIAPGDQERLFEPFQQLDGSIRRQHGGSGLGLSISKRFVEMHRGRMWLESKVGVGTTFYFSLPIETPFLAQTTSAGDARRWFNPYESAEYRLRTRRSKAPAPVVVSRFVLVEKEGALGRLLKHYLDDLEIISVRDIRDAVHELDHSPAQALIVNAAPSEMKPEEMGRLANLPYGTPVLTCWVPGDDEAAKRLGVIRYLVKPIARETLLSTIEELGEDARSILLVDDHPDALQLFSRMLASGERSYDILQARNGQRALSLLRQRRPDVMLLDLIMPKMDGFQVLQEKSQDPTIRDIPVIVISARDPANGPVVSTTMTVGCSGGISVRNLLACIRAVSEILSPSSQSVGQAQPGLPGA